MTPHTRTGLSKWDKITMWSIAALVFGFVGTVTLDLADIHGTVANIIGVPFMLLEIAGFVMSFIAAPKVFGGIKTGVTAVIAGFVFFIVGKIMKETPEPSIIMGVEFPPFSDPLYIIGSPLYALGIFVMIVGSIMAVVTYLRRILRAVEGNKPNGNS